LLRLRWWRRDTSIVPHIRHFNVAGGTFFIHISDHGLVVHHVGGSNRYITGINSRLLASTLKSEPTLVVSLEDES